MVVGISKRQQFRNERALQDLIRSVPGNDRCADCQAMNPGWASWNMGIFLCMRCAALHRKMGTHISKVKSLSMDSWSSEQVDNMKSHGNILMNKIFNPRNVKPPVPADVDEADACMERFIRQKYQYRSLEDGKPKPPARDEPSPARDGPSPGDRSPEGSPPPLPPKPSRPFGFGLRSASSATNLNRMSKSPGLSLRSPSPPPPLPTTRSASQGLDASSGGMNPASFESMMNILRDKGFQNERRNAAVLRGLDGNLEKSIETLLRLGEGSGPVSRERTPAPTTTSSSTNPFDMLDAKPQSTQPTGQSYNPFDMPTTQPAAVQQPLEQSFQNLQVSQPLFPHSTGGYPNQPSQPFYQQPSATPPVPATFTRSPYVQSPQPVDHNPFFQSQPNMAAPAPAPAQPSNLGQTNPFFTPAPTSASMQQAPNPAPTSMPMPNPPRHANTMPALSSTSPFGQPSPFQSAPPAQPQPQLQQQQQQPAQLQPLQTGAVSHNPFHSMTGPTTPHSAGYLQPQQQFGFQGSGFAGQLAPQPTGRVDKNSILSLYSFAPAQSQPQPQPQLQPQAQQPFSAPQSAGPTAQGFSQPSPFNSTPQVQAPQPQPQQPAGNFQSGTRNPFFTAPPGSAFPQQQQQGLAPNAPFAAPMNSAPPTTTAFPRGHMSQQSVDINGLQNGRHSPDAFTGLSARYG